MELFGPYPVGSSISEAMKTLTKAFQLRDCSDYDFKIRKTPCILYQMHQCSAPCVGKISKKDYAKDLEDSLLLLRGKRKSQKALSILEEKMLKHAESEEFEQAAMQRDYIESLSGFSENNFDRLNNWLRSQGYTVETVPYSEISKMEGLLRCTTLPLKRRYP